MARCSRCRQRFTPSVQGTRKNIGAGVTYSGTAPKTTSRTLTATTTFSGSVRRVGAFTRVFTAGLSAIGALGQTLIRTATRVVGYGKSSDAVYYSSVTVDSPVDGNRVTDARKQGGTTNDSAANGGSGTLSP